MVDISTAQTALTFWKSAVEATQIEPLPIVHNPLWRVTSATGQDFVLKELPEFPPGAGPVDEFRVLCHLQEAGVSIALPIITDDGRIFTIVGERRYALLPYLPHEPGNHELRAEAAATARSIGAAIGRMDVALRECAWRPDSFVDDWAKFVLQDALPKLPAEAVQPVAPLIDGLTASLKDLPFQLTHGDCNDGNVLIGPDGTVRFIDLDHLPAGPRVGDLSKYLGTRLRAHLTGPDPEQNVTAMMAVLTDYIDGYHEAAQLSRYERDAVIPLVLTIELGHAEWCLHGWTPRPEGYRASLQVINWITTHFQELTSIFSA